MSGLQAILAGPASASAAAYSELRSMMGDIGLSVGVWAPGGAVIEPWQPACELTDTLERAGAGIERACRGLAMQAASAGRPISETIAAGHCIIAVPSYRRRRLIAAVAASFPVREILDDGSLSRLCGTLELDKQVLAGQAAEAARAYADQADVFVKMLAGALTSLQAAHDARRDIQSFSKNLTSTYEELSLLYRVSGSMWVTRQPEEFLQNVCNELLEVMNVSAAAAIAYAHPPAIEEDLIVTAGTPGLAGQVTDLIAHEVAPKLAAEGHPIISNQFSAGGDGQIDSVVAVPLASDEEMIGILVGLNKVHGEFDSVDMKLISAIAGQASVFLANNRLYADLQDLLMGVLHALTASIDAKDPYTSGHSQRVALISKRLAEECGFEPEKVQQIYLAGLLHDIGKIGVPEAILRKEGKLTAEEYDDMKRHPMLGANILGGIRQLDEVVVGILTHHERPDGKGYPRGLKGDDIPVEGRIICIADCFDAMSSYRTYRKALPLSLVIDELKTNSGTQFDAELVEKFLTIDLEGFMVEIHQPARTVFPLRTHRERNS